jgi:spore coat polysaccharide biosynthesis protein SpsF (cytidylyltransferase family)
MNSAKDTTNDWAKKYERGVRTYAIWWNPADFPGKFVVRGATSYADHVDVDEDCELASSLEEARSKVPDGFVMIARHPTDPPGIVECWV